MTRFARRAERVQHSAIREFLALAGDPRITSFAGGYPDPTLFPIAELHKIYDDLLSADNASALQYTASEGLPELRALVAARLTADGMPCTADDVLITQGGQQGLDLTAKLFIDPGEIIITERPTFLGALIAFNPCEPDFGPESHAIAMVLDGRGCDRPGVVDRDIYAIFNAWREPLSFVIPSSPTGRIWRRTVDTALPSPDDALGLDEGPVIPLLSPYRVGARSVVILVSEPS